MEGQILYKQSELIKYCSIWVLSFIYCMSMCPCNTLQKRFKIQCIVSKCTDRISLC